MKKQYKVGIYCRLSVDDASNSAKAKNYKNGLRLNRIALSKKSDSAEHPSQTAYVLEQISQRGKIIVHAAVCAVHIVVDSDKTHALLREQHFRVKPYLQVVSP